MNGYSVVIDGVTIQCQTAAEAIRLAKEAAALNGAVHQTATTTTQAVPPPAQPPATPPTVVHLSAHQAPASDVADEVQSETRSKWTEPAKRVIVLLAACGSDGVDVDRVAEVAGLKGAKGSTPLKAALIDLLGVDDAALDRPRGADGRKRWVLKPRGVRAAAKLGLLPQAEANRP